MEFATACADDAIRADSGPLSLCCGRAGKGFAALALFGATGDDHWRVAAQNVVMDVLRDDGDDGNPEYSLFRGQLGVALLAAELTQPERASMPLVQAIR
jgi:serine/threonine-protein kinase